MEKKVRILWYDRDKADSKKLKYNAMQELEENMLYVHVETVLFCGFSLTESTGRLLKYFVRVVLQELDAQGK